MWKILSCITPLLLAAAGPGLAQDEAPPAEFGEELTITEVQIDVLVTDRAGNVIVGLDADDFVVREDGEPVELTDVTFYSNRQFVESLEKAGELGIEPAAIPTERYFILFFHDQRHLFSRLMVQQLDAARWVRRWVDEEVLPNDYVAVVSYLHKLKIHQDFTTDKETLKAAVDAAAQGRDPGGNWPSRQGDAAQGPTLLPFLPQGDLLRARTNLIYDGLEVLANAAGHTPGRKNLALFSIGFGDVNTFGFYAPDQRYYPGMVRALNDNNVAVYSVDLVPSNTSFHPLEQALNGALSDISSATGGRYYSNFVNFLTPLSEISEDNNGYYLLSYRSRHPRGTRGYQRVEVDTENPEFRIRARRGYLYGDEIASAQADGS